MRKPLVIFLMMLVGSSLAWAGDKASPVAMRDSPSTQIVASSGKLKVVVRIDTGIIGGHDPRLLMCRGTTHPCRGVERLQITANRQSLFVPVSSFFDLADLRAGKITFSGDEATLLLDGGDASESYSVKIRFNENRVISRALFSEISPDTPLQETSYHEVVLD